jgi:hypothetical protein
MFPPWQSPRHRPILVRDFSMGFWAFFRIFAVVTGRERGYGDRICPKEKIEGGGYFAGDYDANIFLERTCILRSLATVGNWSIGSRNMQFVVSGFVLSFSIFLLLLCSCFLSKTSYYILLIIFNSRDFSPESIQSAVFSCMERWLLIIRHSSLLHILFPVVQVVQH